MTDTAVYHQQLESINAPTAVVMQPAVQAISSTEKYWIKNDSRL